MKQEKPRTVAETARAGERLRLFREAVRQLKTAQRGTTLVEVLIVVAIIAMVAGGVAFFAFPKFKESQTKAAVTGARVIRGAAQNWQMTNDGCPTISQLIQDKQLDKAQDTNDPWGGDYTIVCTDDDIVVSSDGADKKKGSADDVSVPKVASAEEGG
jgi:general secretion pathway protein G